MATEPINNVDSSLVNITIRLIMQGKVGALLVLFFGLLQSVQCIVLVDVGRCYIVVSRWYSRVVHRYTKQRKNAFSFWQIWWPPSDAFYLLVTLPPFAFTLSRHLAETRTRWTVRCNFAELFSHFYSLHTPSFIYFALLRFDRLPSRPARNGGTSLQNAKVHKSVHKPSQWSLVSDKLSHQPDATRPLVHSERLQTFLIALIWSHFMTYLLFEKWDAKRLWMCSVSLLSVSAHWLLPECLVSALTALSLCSLRVGILSGHQILSDFLTFWLSNKFKFSKYSKFVNCLRQTTREPPFVTIRKVSRSFISNSVRDSNRVCEWF